MFKISGDPDFVSKWQNLITLITAFAKRPFNFGGYYSIDDILDKLGVDVILESGIVSERVVPRELKDAQEFWKKECCKEENSGTNNKEIEKAKGIKGMVDDDINSWKMMPLRGCYIPDENVIKLYPDEMVTEYDGMRMEELIVSTLAHETMHAYYNCQNDNCHQYVAFFEEPLAEFGMLLYLKETNCVFYDWAKKDVAIKPTFYRYGAYLMDQDLSALGRDSSLRQFLEGYKIMRPVISEPEIINGNI